MRGWDGGDFSAGDVQFSSDLLCLCIITTWAALKQYITAIALHGTALIHDEAADRGAEEHGEGRRRGALLFFWLLGAGLVYVGYRSYIK